MPDVIQLLPDSVANQIAAGEVVQRPASVVKELMENSIDAGGKNIQVVIRDGGKALIQIIDDGCGMSETDARLCFERHATSKIRQAHDLFAIQTMGFRGEAMASIAAVAEVEMKTRLHDASVGTSIRISGSEVVEHEATSCPAGTSICVKNLFFNIPARRKFLKSSSLELKHIISEFQRVSLANPSVAFSLSHNGADVYKLSAGNVKQRISQLMGKNLGQHLIDISTQTSVIEISGFIGKPDSAKKSPGEQFFFVNNRYMKNPYLHKAVMRAYEKLIPTDSIPPYFIFLKTDPSSIDVNIHPTKTEIKFEDERMIWQILNASVREAMGKFAIVPSIDFDTEMVVDIPFFPPSAPVSPPEIAVNPDYNPFDRDYVSRSSSQQTSRPHRPSARGWQDLFQQEQGKGFEEQPEPQSPILFNQVESEPKVPKPSERFFQVKNRFILTSVKSGLMVIDQKRAHERILYENYLQSISSGAASAQQELFPQTIELSAGDFALLHSVIDDLAALGVMVSFLGQNTIAVNALPSNVKVNNAEQLIQGFLEAFKENTGGQADDMQHRLALSLAKAGSIPYNRSLEPIEMQDLVDKLFACQQPNLSPDGKPTITILGVDELEKRFR
ncbi:MAG: DNA mismatch repair endonuclease MutL [Tenuifilaceae bacterium]|jgi:DNA mismatch repair protein MutL|nr:DNA mismatch repair endonuclease MutL [Tenuifilaceae bacterium]